MVEDSSNVIPEHQQVVAPVPEGHLPSSNTNGEHRGSIAKVKTGLGKASALTHHSLDKAAAMTHHSFDKAAAITDKATSMTTKNVGKVIKSSESVYETSPLCCLPRFLCQFPKFWPRTFSLIFGVIVPLWFLILIAAGFGVLLAKAEAPSEQAANDGVLASRAILDYYNLDIDALVELPSVCYQRYQDEPNRTTLEDRLDLFLISSNSTSIIENNNNSTNSTNATEYTLEDVIEDTDTDLLNYMMECQSDYAPSVTLFLESQSDYDSSAGSDLSFNWNRCWRDFIDDEWGSESFIFFPSPRLILASRPERQAQTYTDEWLRVQTELFEASLPENATQAERDRLFESAAMEATGGAVCHDNVEGTSWFFFTVMTTVGYGNQAPVTDDGRLLIYIAGTFSLILFAAVLGSTGYIILAVFDDFVSRFWLSKCLKYPIVGVLLWGSIWLCWSLLIATDADLWWQARLPDFDADQSDTLWFAFISTSTIGLGDYFLQPEIIFASDALKFSVEFLVGFVFLSTFLNKIGEFLFSIMPQRTNSLEARLHATNIILWKHWPCKAHSVETLEEALEEEVEKMDHHARVEMLKSLLDDGFPPTPLREHEDESLPTMLEEEETILKALLASVESRRKEAQDSSNSSLSVGGDDDPTAVAENSSNEVESDDTGDVEIVDSDIISKSLMTGAVTLTEDVDMIFEDASQDDPAYST